MNNCPITYKIWKEVHNTYMRGDYGSYGQIRAIKGKYDQIRVYKATHR